MRWLDSPIPDEHTGKLNVDLWHTPGMLPAYKRRVLLTHWDAEAAAEANRDDDALMAIFVRTGDLCAMMVCAR